MRCNRIYLSTKGKREKERQSYHPLAARYIGIRVCGGVQTLEIKGPREREESDAYTLYIAIYTEGTCARIFGMFIKIPRKVAERVGTAVAFVKRKRTVYLRRTIYCIHGSRDEEEQQFTLRQRREKRSPRERVRIYTRPPKRKITPA